ncbi:hypothetical protein [Falsiroseomonas sp.]|uniref:hypothetical protein n=1 Tax=Falsiroseomonas sp. TaxID=2870721 RepID=UPI0027189F52|nr:hypothetical protein [Falsiroseomonas sp.]MDO9501960.1 hypothetical protein [Falsiroseomonas sp.]MDP3418787.1 hypothetical protein [Falsiroseomonas sp.]
MATSPTARRAPRARPATSRAKGRAPARPEWLARWWKVALLVALITLGLPLAHAMFGEIFALLGGAVLFGFLLGRWTAGL